MRITRLGIACVMLVCLHGFAQYTQRQNNLPDYSNPPSLLPNTDLARGQMKSPADIQKRLADQERRKRMQADAERLGILSAELKADVARMSTNDTPVDVTRKAAEAEKIAKELRRLNSE